MFANSRVLELKSERYLRGLDVFSHFKTNIIIIRRRDLYKDLAQYLNFKLI